MLGYDRLFTFGCSFTKYHWPTWADILGQEFIYYENWGQTGGSNPYILNSLVECLQSRTVGQKDLVIIMWTTAGRSEFYRNKRWFTPGNNIHVFAEHELQINKNAEYDDMRGHLLKDAISIHTARKILELEKIPYIFLALAPYGYTFQGTSSSNALPANRDIYENFKESIELIKPSILEKVFKFDIESRPFENIQDSHEKPSVKIYNQLKGTNWPSYEKWLIQDYTGIQEEIIKEIQTSNDEYLRQIVATEGKKTSTNFFRRIHRLEKRVDIHPTPLEHYEYIQKVLPEFPISEKTMEFVKTSDSLLREHGINLWTEKPIVRL